MITLHTHTFKQHFTFIVFLLVVAIALFACEDAFEKGDTPLLNGEAVAISCTQLGDGTRTTIDPDDMATTRWCSGDQLYVWATADQGATYALAAEPFTLYYFGVSYSDAVFTASINPLETNTYTYYGAYPKPLSVNGTEVTYEILAEQTGAYDGVNDVMVATPLVTDALQSMTPPAGSISFTHLTHAIRIRIPEDKNLLQDSIGKLVVTFPQAVVGNITFDVADTDIAPTFSNGSNVVTLNFDTPVGEGDYVWMFVNPSYISGEISFEAYSVDGYKATTITTQLDKQLAAGRVTPIALTVPTELIYTEITLSITANNLGEDLEKITFTAPSGTTFRGDQQTIVFEPNEDDEYTVAYYPSLYASSFVSSGIDISYESASAIKKVNLSLSSITEGEANILTAQVPYLLDENFSSISASSSTETSTSSLAGLTGWTAGNRCEWWAGYCVALRSYSNMFGPYDSRMNSLPMGDCGLKSEATVTLKINFNSDWVKNKSSSMGLIVGRASSTGIDDTISNSSTLTLSTNSSASYTNVVTPRSVEVSNFTSTQFIAWKTSGANGSYFNYDPVYIDDVKVQIVP